MSLRYILGRAGSGKTSLCIKEIEYSNRNTNNSLIFIVPEQFSLEAERKLIDASENSATIKSQVLSFDRLAYRLFSKTGKSKTKILEDNGKNMLLRKIIFDLKDELKFFSKAVDKQGFIEKLSETITEFYQYDLSLEKLSAHLENLTEKENLFLKTEDLFKIYKAYLDYLSNEYISSDEMLDLLAEKLNDTDFLNDTEIWIDGFTGFTPQEYKVIEKLLIKSKNVNITFTMQEKQVFYENLKFYDPFRETKSSINKITSIARENKIPIIETTFLNISLRFEKNNPLYHLEENYLKYKTVPFLQEPENIKILRLQNIQSEVLEVAKYIHYFVSEKQYRYKDIAIVSADVKESDKIIKGVFDNYKIPCFFDAKTDILGHPLTELIRSIVSIVSQNYSYESVFRFLKTDMTSIAKEDIDILENYVLAYGIKGYKWMFETWKFGFDTKYETFDSITIHETKNHFLDLISPFAKDITYNSKLTVKEFCTNIYKTLSKLEVTKSLEKFISDSENENPLQHRLHKQIWQKLLTVFYKMVEILGDEEVTVREFEKILDAGLIDVQMGVIPPTQDTVIIGDFQRTRLPNIKILFVIGVNDNVLPRPSIESGIFTDEERVSLENIGMELAPDSYKKTFAEQLYIYEVITKPTDFLFFSYSLGNLAGKTLRASTVISKLKKIFSEINELHEMEDMLSKVTLPKPTFSDFAIILRDYASGKETPEIYLDIYNWFRDSEIYKNKLTKLESLLFTRNKEYSLKKDNVNKLYGNEIVTSVSRIEKYVSCPYSYFVQYNLEAKERKLYNVDYADIGSLFHNVIEVFSEKLKSANLNYRTVSKEQINSMTEICVDEIVPEIGGKVFLENPRMEYVVKRIKRISKRSIWAISEHIKEGLFEPLGNELEFALDNPVTKIVLNINETQKLILTGRIDRVDIFDDTGKQYVKIIDYKSGSTSFDMSDIYYGMQLQLIIYLDAFIKSTTKLYGKDNISSRLTSGGVFYFNIKDPILTCDSDISSDRLEKLILNDFKMSGLVLAKENVINALDNNISGSSNVIPVYIKTNGEFGANSSVATEEEFEEITNFANNKVLELGKEIFGGNIDVFPFKKGSSTGCDYCIYKSICQFDIIEKDKKYNVMKKLDKETIIEFMKKDFQS